MRTVRIPLGKSGFPVAWALIDEEDYERVIAWRWYMNKNRYPFITHVKEKRPTIHLHNFVLNRVGVKDGLEVDHIDRDPLNNTKANLRLVTKVENMANTRVNDRMSQQTKDFKQIAIRLRESGCSIQQISEGLSISVPSARGYVAEVDTRPLARGR